MWVSPKTTGLGCNPPSDPEKDKRIDGYYEYDNDIHVIFIDGLQSIA